ncbi:MAG TPA: chaperone modulator CbpM [Solirubrobacteraceae bacterium]|nr:chaperone modulator CbpM [Solirubrobacteraceae bacterium]
MTTPTRYALVARTGARGQTVDLQALAAQAGVHPELVRRLVRTGLLETAGGTLAAPVFSRDAPGMLARALRLRRDLGLNYAGALLAGRLLARIDELEARLARYENPDHPRR